MQRSDIPAETPISSKQYNNHRSGRELLKATEPFSKESVPLSWWLVGSTFALLIMAFAGAALTPGWLLRTVFAVLAGLLLVRAFITYHDYMHGAILRDSRIAWVLFRLYSVFALAPPRSWRQSHNYHHGHVGKLAAENIGAFPIVTAQMWQEFSFWERFKYRFIRHPLVMLSGYVTIFGISITLLPLLQNPARHWDSAVVLLGHGALIALFWIFGGFDMAFFVVILPMIVMTILGSYLFYAQHSYEDMQIVDEDEWSHTRASLESSSYLRLNRVMQWFTGNIGFHHIHHLNFHIPFYRLPETMSAIPELQSPATTTLAPRDIFDCFKSNLWDEEQQRMVSYREANINRKS